MGERKGNAADRHGEVFSVASEYFQRTNMGLTLQSVPLTKYFMLIGALLGSHGVLCDVVAGSSWVSAVTSAGSWGIQVAAGYCDIVSASLWVWGMISEMGYSFLACGCEISHHV